MGRGWHRYHLTVGAGAVSSPCSRPLTPARTRRTVAREVPKCWATAATGWPADSMARISGTGAFALPRPGGRRPHVGQGSRPTFGITASPPPSQPARGPHTPCDYSSHAPALAWLSIASHTATPAGQRTCQLCAWARHSSVATIQGWRSAGAGPTRVQPQGATNDGAGPTL